MWNLIHFFGVAIFFLQLNHINGCTVPFSPIPPSINEKVFHSDVVLSGKVVGKELDLQRSMFGSPVYKAQLKVYCIYKGKAMPQNFTLATVGAPGSNCPSIHLRVRKEYILYLTKTTDDRYVPTYFPDAFTSQSMTDILQVCGVGSLHPIVKGNDRYLMSCSHVRHGDCIPHEPHFKITATTRRPQIETPPSTPRTETPKQRKTPVPKTTKNPVRSTIIPMTAIDTVSKTTTMEPETTSNKPTTTTTKWLPPKTTKHEKPVVHPKYEQSDSRNEANSGTGQGVEVQREPVVVTKSQRKSEESDGSSDTGQGRRGEPAIDAVVHTDNSGQSGLGISLLSMVTVLITVFFLHQ